MAEAKWRESDDKGKLRVPVRNFSGKFRDLGFVRRRLFLSINRKKDYGSAGEKCSRYDFHFLFVITIWIQPSSGGPRPSYMASSHDILKQKTCPSGFPFPTDKAI